MGRSYNLGTILAIAIPLGVVALIGVLALSFTIIRLSIVSSREKRAYLMARHGDFRRRSAASSDSDRSFRKRYRERRGWCDFLCCVPAEFVPSTPGFYVDNKKGNASKLKNGNGREQGLALRGVKRDDMPTDAVREAQLRHSKQETIPDLKIAGQGHNSFEQLSRKTDTALNAAERRKSESQAASQVYPQHGLAPKAPDHQPRPPAPAVLPGCSQSPMTQWRDPNATARTSFDDPPFVPSVWSYPVSPSTNDLLSNSDSRLGSSPRYQKSDPEPSFEGPLSLPAFQQTPLSVTYPDTSYHSPTTPPDAIDLLPPARAFLRNIATPRISPKSSLRGKLAASALHGSAETPDQKRPEGDALSVYETPPIAPLDIARHSGSPSSSSRTRAPRFERKSDGDSLRGKGIITSLDSNRRDPDLIQNRHTSQDEASRSLLEKQTSIEANKDESALHKTGDEKPGHQRIADFLKRDESLNNGNERVGRQQIERGHSMIPSFSGSLDRESYQVGGTSSIHDAPLRPGLFSGLGDGGLKIGEDSAERSLMPIPRTPERSGQSHSADSLLRTPSDKLSIKSIIEPLLRGSRTSSLKKNKQRNATKGGNVVSDAGSQMSSPLALSSNSVVHSSRSSSLTVSTGGAHRISTGATGSRMSATAFTTAKLTTRPQAVKVSSSIRDIAQLSVPHTPRSPGYSPGQPGSHVPYSDHDSLKTSHQIGQGTRRLSTLVYGTGAQAKPGHKYPNRYHPNEDSSSKTSVSPRVRVSKNTRRNKPLPTTPHIGNDGVVANMHGARYFVIQEYSKNLGDEVQLLAGEIAKVYQVFDDGWCLVRVLGEPSRTGVCPFSCLKKLEK